MSTHPLREVTGSEAGYSGAEQIQIALDEIIRRDGVAQTPDLYAAMEAVLNPQGFTLSKQGQASLRFFVNKVAVEAGHIVPYDDQDPGWRITPDGRDWLQAQPPIQEVAMMQDLNIDDEKRAQLAQLFKEFATTYPDSAEYQLHLDLRPRGQEEGRKNFYEVLEASERGEDITDLVLLKLLPHNDNAPNREKGAWIHIAPTITGNLKRWFENAGWTDPADWPQISRAILDFVRRCNDNPEDLQAACDHFTALPYATGFQCAMLTPILNALRPDDFLLINNKPRLTVNYFLGESFGQNLTEYPAINAAGRKLISALADDMRQLDAPGMSPQDRFDIFSHWLVAIKKFSFRPVRYWKIAPGHKAWNWDACLKGNFIAIGWDELGDISELSQKEFISRRDALLLEHDGWTKVATDQVWRFARIPEGDRIVANRGTQEVLGIGTVVGPYYFVPGQRHGHRLPVEWDDTTPRSVQQGGWRRTLVALKEEDFRAVYEAPPSDQPPVVVATHAQSPFSASTFDMLAQLHETPTHEFYTAHKDALTERVVQPFKQLMNAVPDHLSASILDRMETGKRIFANILKQFTVHGCWDFYWGAFYPKGGKRTEDAQLFLWLNRDRLEYGFYIGEYGSEQRQRFMRNCQENYDVLVRVLRDQLPDRDLLFFGQREDFVGGPDGLPKDKTWPTFQDWLKNPAAEDIHAAVFLPKHEVLQLSQDYLAQDIADVYKRLFPLVLLATLDDPMPAIGTYLDWSSLPDTKPEYPLSQFAAATGFDLQELENWVRAVERKGQVIFHGPPGTGKTFAAEHLARHLVGGGDGFYELVQFHPAYAYEDFMQGIRPKPRPDGRLDYPVVPGRFLQFIEESRECNDRCVLIVDEINRANLARVFGELMYLLEYRDREIPLAAGGTLRIPSNVRIIGTMNTADRSIALVDHALRRRFAFLALYPNYDILQTYHSATGFDPAHLISVLRRLNKQINDPHYEVGITFFLRDDLADQLEDIWRMEIEPYLDEYFFDQPEKARAFGWDRIGGDFVT